MTPKPRTGVAAYGLLALALQAAAKPTLEITSSSISACGAVEFKYGGGNPPYVFSAVTAFLPTQNATLQVTSGSSSWQCLFPAINPALKAPTRVTFMLQDANGDFSTATRLYDVGEGSTTCKAAESAFEFGWAQRNGGDPGKRVPQCKALTVTTEIAANVNRSIDGPISLFGVIPGGEVWKVDTAPPGTPELTFTLNVAKGNDVFLLTRDSNGREGGSTNLLSVIPGSECGNLHGEQRRGLGVGAVAGIVVGIVLGAILVAVGTWLFWRRRHASKKAVAAGPVPDGFSIDEPTPFMDSSPPTPYSEVGPADLYTAAAGEGNSEASRTSYAPRTSKAAMVQRLSTNPSTMSHRSHDDTSMSMTMTSRSSYDATRTLPQRKSALEAALVAGTSQEPIYRIQDDAGPVPDMAAETGPQVVDMPPTYNPSWQGSQTGTN